MKPKNFTEANQIFKRPPQMQAEECGDLPVFNDGKQLVSCWEMEPDEKLCAAFFGELWVGVYGQAQPPLWFMTRNPFTFDEAHTLPSEEVVENFINRKVRQYVEKQFVTEGADAEAVMQTMLKDFLNFVFSRNL